MVSGASADQLHYGFIKPVCDGSDYINHPGIMHGGAAAKLDLGSLNRELRLVPGSERHFISHHTKPCATLCARLCFACECVCVFVCVSSEVTHFKYVFIVPMCSRVLALLCVCV